MTNDDKADLVVSGLYTSGSRIVGYNATSLAPGLSPLKVFTPLTLGGDMSMGCS